MMTEEQEFEYTEQQLSAIEMVKNNSVSILTGGPGTGKTTTTRGIITWAKSQNMKILQAAPTGKAAKRMMDSTDHPATTIHTMLQCHLEKGYFEFKYREGNPLQADLVILDEISMITNDLMCRVMEAISPKHTKLLLVGDQDQLPSVGAGAVLRDLLKSKIIRHVELDVVLRNTGSIVKACHQIKHGRIYTAHSKLDLEATSPINLVHIECDTPERTLAGIETIMCDRMPLRGYDPVKDIQVISPVNTRGELSCESINKKIRKRLNPSKANGMFEDDSKEDQYPFRPGDKVINTKNSRLTNTDGALVMVVNGDIGFVLDIEGKDLTVKFLDPDREVIIPKKEKNLLHAYCITCHRFQGSEAPVIIIPVHRQFDFFLSNSWIYTAISRGKQIVVTIGRFRTIARAIKNRVPNNRTTMLESLLTSAHQAKIEEEFPEI